MEFQTSLSLLVLTAALLLFFKLSSGNSAKIQLPPGPPQLPIIGNLHNVLSPVSFRVFRDLALRYGPDLMFLRVGQIKVFVVSSREAALEIMKNQDLNFSYRPELAAANVATYGCTDIAFSPPNDYWRQLRRICALELLSKGRIRSFSWLRAEESNKFVKYIAEKRNQSVNIFKKSLELSNDIICRATFGSNCSDQHKFIEAAQGAILLAAGFCFVDLFPSLKFLDVLTGFRFKMAKILKDTNEVFDKIFKERMLRRETTKDGDDLLSVLLNCKEGVLEVPITMDNIKAVILDIFSGGTETTATLIEWTMSELMRHPKAMEKAQREIREALKGKEEVEESDIAELPYLKSVIKEALRLHPPVPLLVPRLAKETATVQGYTIPAGSRVMINAWAIQRDPKCWEDAESFKPERFEGNLVDFRGHSFEFIPFGAGRRICPGMNFGLTVAQLVLAKLLFYFDWQLPHGMKIQDLDMTEKAGITAGRKFNLMLVATPRYTLPATS